MSMGDGQLNEATRELSSVTDAPAALPQWHRRRRWLRALIVVGIVVLVGAGSVALGGALLIHRYDSKVQRADILKDVPHLAAPVADVSPLNLLVLGSDSTSPDATGFDATGAQSDTIMIVHILAGRKAAFVFSIPRDSYVDVPATGAWGGGMNKIDAAMAYGGASAAAKTVYELTKIPLNGAMVVNFGGIHTMVDVVGTVHVCIPYDVWDSFTPTLLWSQGCHDMNGADAETFMRDRMGTPAGDFARMYDQQLVVKALANQIASAGMLTNPLKLDHLISVAAGSVTVDKDMDLRKLILDLKDIDPNKVKTALTPWSGTGQESAGSVVYLNMPAAQALFQAVIDDKTDAWLAAHPQNVPTWDPPTS